MAIIAIHTVFTGRYPLVTCLFLFVCVDGQKIRGRMGAVWRCFCAVLDVCAMRAVLRAYVATQRTFAPSLCANTTAPQQTLKTDIGIEARGNIIAYRQSGLVQRRAAAPYWQADCSVSAMCGHLRYVPDASLRFGNKHRRGVCCGLMLLRNAPLHPTGRHSAIPLCQHSAAHVHFAPTPDCPSDLPITPYPYPIRATSQSRPYNLNFPTKSILFVI